MKIPTVNLELARELFDLLHDIIHHSLENKMTATVSSGGHYDFKMHLIYVLSVQNLAIVIGPSLLWSKTPTMDVSAFDKSI